MSFIIYKLLWFCVHLGLHFVEIAIAVLIFVYTKLEELIILISKLKFSGSIDYDINYINNVTDGLPKIPSHLVIILSEDKFNAKVLKSLVLWSEAAGIKYLSLYDYQDIFENDCHQLTEQLEAYLVDETNNHSGLKSDTSLNNLLIQQKTEASWSCKPKNIRLKILTLHHGKPELISLCQQFGYASRCDRLKSTDITPDLIDKKLKEGLNNIPDPDVALYFGDVCCTFGLLPWQIRLTEFFGLGKSSNVSVEKYTNILRKYAKCEQRFGK